MHLSYFVIFWEKNSKNKFKKKSSLLPNKNIEQNDITLRKTAYDVQLSRQLSFTKLFLNSSSNFLRNHIQVQKLFLSSSRTNKLGPE
jgi:hypothetical protein